jgi:hypothetical protein
MKDDGGWFSFMKIDNVVRGLKQLIPSINLIIAVNVNHSLAK